MLFHRILLIRDRKISIMSPLFFALMLIMSPAALADVGLNVIDDAGIPVSGFHWLIEHDNTYNVIPGEPVPDPLAVSLHNSYSRIIAQGTTPGSMTDLPVPMDGERYLVSVLPLDGHSMGGTAIKPGQTHATITVTTYPLPSAQISVFIYNDIKPLNNEPDIPAEAGLEDFSVVLFDLGGQMMLDAFGFMLGTTYVLDGNGHPVLNPEGAPIVDQIGSGILKTDANGELVIRYIPQGKYGIEVVPPAGEGWTQTSTIEGKPTVDAWVKPGESQFFIEFGPSFYHIFIGFVQPRDILDTLPNPSGETVAVSGQLVLNHLSSPPELDSYPGIPVPRGWVGLNNSTSSDNLYTAETNEDGSFSIAGVPPGAYQLVAFDTDLDYIFAFQTVEVVQGSSDIYLGDILMNGWFGQMFGSVFYDTDGDGFRDSGEPGLRNQEVLLRFRDGTIYGGAETDPMGRYRMPEVFPFFHFLVAEVDFARYKATGATFVVDSGGEIPPADGWNMPSFNELNPLPQAEINPNTGNNLSRTETGVVLTQAMSLMAGQSNYVDWGKQAYPMGENGGISGLVYYAVTRAEDDPRYAGAEESEPGIAGVQIALYADFDNDLIIDDLDNDGLSTLADVDNPPVDNFPGSEDTDYNSNGLYDPGDALNITYTDSWDESLPEGCLFSPFDLHGETITDCYDGFRNWNQMTDGLFDGGYAFDAYFPGGMVSGSEETDGIPSGYYIVEAALPAGMSHLKEEDKNVDFGDSYIPGYEALAPVCVGDPHLVPEELSLFPGIEAPYAGDTRPLCNRKQIELTSGNNAAVEFFFLTYVPRAARGVGFTNNDLAAEFQGNSPVFGEKAAASWVPISFQDFQGNEIARTHADEFGAYSIMLPSNFTNNLGTPAGSTPNMVVVSLNHPGPIADPDNPGQYITDPWFNPGYSQVAYTLNFSPGRVTYLDTPVLPLGAFLETPGTPLDYQFPSGTPLVLAVNGPAGGPYVPGPGTTITISSLGAHEVTNPAYDPQSSDTPSTIRRDYSFGTVPGSVTVNGVPLENILWASDGLSISGTVPSGMETGQLVITRGDNGVSSELSVTLHVGHNQGDVIHMAPGDSIQETIDLASDGDLIIIPPGFYHENVVLWKNVTLQGTGPYSTYIDAAGIMEIPKRTIWQAQVQAIIDNNAVDLAPGQSAEEVTQLLMGPGILVLLPDDAMTPATAARIDGLNIYGSVFGGGILVNAYARGLMISNNRILSNQGQFGGGIVVGQPSLVDVACPDFCNSDNSLVRIHNNHITLNSGILSGGGIALHNGADGYIVEQNLIAGNLSRSSGAGVTHYGFSSNGMIRSNDILFNEAFYGGEAAGDGGGIYVSGELPIGEESMTPGSGSVSILNNLIQGNLSGSGSGGGICLMWINGQDVVTSTNPPMDWHEIQIYNNILLNNAAGYRGGGMYLQDAARVKFVHNTVTYNDCLATAADAFSSSGALQSNPQPAGVVSMAHSPALQVAIGSSGSGPEFAGFSNPMIANSVISQNHSFNWDETADGGNGAIVVNTTMPQWDLQVLGTGSPELLSPMFCILSDSAGYDPSNIDADPEILKTYSNDYFWAKVGDEGGNAVSLAFKPLTQGAGNAHIKPISPGIDMADASYVSMSAWLQFDIDGNLRPDGSLPDIGADEISLTSVYPDALGVFAMGTWYLDLNNDGQWLASDDAYYLFGGFDSMPVPGDWNGDGVTEIGVYQNGSFYMDINGNGIWDSNFIDRRVRFSVDGGKYQDWSDLSRDNSEFMNPPKREKMSSAIMEQLMNPDEAAPRSRLVSKLEDRSLSLNSNNPNLSDSFLEVNNSEKFVDMSTYPIAGDWNGDGKSEIGLFDNGTWYLDFNGNGIWDGYPQDRIYLFGDVTSKPVPGDWNGDGITEIGIASGGQWFLDYNGNGLWDGQLVDRHSVYGLDTDIPVTGDWDGNGFSGIGSFAAGYWYLDMSANGIWDGCIIDACYGLGRYGFTPVMGKW